LGWYNIRFYGKKKENFSLAFISAIKSKIIIPRNIIEDEYLRLSGNSRAMIFSEIVKKHYSKTVKYSFRVFNLKFQKLNKINLSSALIFPDAKFLLEQLVKMKYKIFISSSVPQKELLDLIDVTLPVELKISLSGVLGSDGLFSKGKPHLEWISSNTNVSIKSFLVIGDDMADFELSRCAGADCILINRKKISMNCHNDVFFISDLNQITKILINEV
jgi:phosphoglycolate phosphatase-like HAD superfamily hydrolase